VPEIHNFSNSSCPQFIIVYNSCYSFTDLETWVLAVCHRVEPRISYTVMPVHILCWHELEMNQQIWWHSSFCDQSWWLAITHFVIRVSRHHKSEELGTFHIIVSSMPRRDWRQSFLHAHNLPVQILKFLWYKHRHLNLNVWNMFQTCSLRNDTGEWILNLL